MRDRTFESKIQKDWYPIINSVGIFSRRAITDRDRERRDKVEGERGRAGQ